ncbi:hypothetical protein FOYG_04537 [Fusarium oxysporum NRRL 32931]|uniref:Uncharacterized protein n=1 Tax=Fusarium oxysporum NRRL 32931 TaxID=660029 RepID=W9IS02_FUSOX|nr:hypothetical protein FOYG_04537 [Fusarium oxysporum NRRL 32931]
MGMYNCQEEHDNLVWDKNDEDFEAAQQQLRLKTFCRKVEGFVQQKFGKPATFVSPFIIGGSNILQRVRVEDMSPRCYGTSAMPEPRSVSRRENNE